MDDVETHDNGKLPNNFSRGAYTYKCSNYGVEIKEICITRLAK